MSETSVRLLNLLWLRFGPLVLKLFLPTKPRADMVSLGNPRGSWLVPDSILVNGSICYCGGVGEDISFDLALIERYGCIVYAFDPTPRAIAHVEAVAKDVRSFHFAPYGLWSREKTLKFFAPRNPNHVSHSAVNLQGTKDYFVASCRRIPDIMQANGHVAIDLLKLDIEGAEYEVLDDLLRTETHPKVLCVEFDQPAPILRTVRMIQRILNAGYLLVSVDAWNYTFVRQL